MAKRKTWVVDWPARVRECVRGKGYETVTAFAEARPHTPMLALAEELGQDVAAIDIWDCLVEEAVAARYLDGLARSALARELWTQIPEGWRREQSEDFRFRLSGALITLSTDMPEDYHAHGRSIAHSMMAAEMPEGWLPEGPDDPLLIAFFDRAKGKGRA